MIFDVFEVYLYCYPNYMHIILDVFWVTNHQFTTTEKPIVTKIQPVTSCCWSKEGMFTAPPAVSDGCLFCGLHIINGNGAIIHSYSQLIGITSWEVQSSDSTITMKDSIRPLKHMNKEYSQKHKMIWHAKAYKQEKKYSGFCMPSYYFWGHCRWTIYLNEKLLRHLYK